MGKLIGLKNTSLGFMQFNNFQIPLISHLDKYSCIINNKYFSKYEKEELHFL